METSLVQLSKHGLGDLQAKLNQGTCVTKLIIFIEMLASPSFGCIYTDLTVHLSSVNSRYILGPSVNKGGEIMPVTENKINNKKKEKTRKRTSK